MPRPARRALITGLVLLLLPACGAGDADSGADNGVSVRPPSTILHDTVAALRAASTVHLYGTVPAGTDSIGLDLHCEHSGDVQGTISLGGSTGDVVLTGGTVYLRGKALFGVLLGALAATRVGDNWVAMPAASGPGADISQALGTFTDFGRLADVLSRPTGQVSKRAVSTVDGRSVVSLSDNGSILYVATTGTPYPVEFRPDTGGQALHFADWDQDVQVSAPGGAIDISSLGGGAPAASPAP